MHPQLEKFQQRMHEFEDEVRRLPTEELEGMLRFGRLTMRNWQVDIVLNTLKRRERDGEYEPKAKRATAWAKVLDDTNL
jgi:hypothetical protein